MNKSILNLPNCISLLRGPLALLFLLDSTPWRLVALCGAILTDSLDGFLARKRNASTRAGTILDPVMDKFFVLFALSAFLVEDQIHLWQACAMLSRDFSLCIFGVFLGLSGKWSEFQIQAIRWGKASTALQFLALSAIILGYALPWLVYALLILFGCLAFYELCQLRRRPYADRNSKSRDDQAPLYRK